MGFMVATAFLSMWMSNTATTMMMIPIALSIIYKLEEILGKAKLGSYSVGLLLGIAFQLTDDALDYSASSEALGKEIGDDLAEGKPTLPLIYAMQRGSKQQADVVRTAIKKGGLEQIDEIKAIIESTGALTATMEAANLRADNAIKALAPLADTPYKKALASLARYAVTRKL